MLGAIYSPLSQAQEASNVNISLQIPNPDLTVKTIQSPLTSVAKKAIPGAELLEPKEIKDEKNGKEEPSIYLNFENASLLSIVNYLGEQKKINLIPHKDLEATKVTLSTRNPLTLGRAWNVLLTLLEMNGFSIIKVGLVHRVVPSKDNGFEPLPSYSSGTGTEPDDLPASDLIVRYIYFFKNIKAEIAQGILKSMLDEKGILINTDLNCCIIKDQCFNIKAAMRILTELDLGGLREQIKIIPLRHANADTIYGLFKDILQLEKEEKTIRFVGPSSQQERTYFSSGTKIYPDPAKNSLILLGTEKNLDKITEFIYKHLDVPLGNAESRLHLYELRYSKAESLKPILEGIIKSPAGSEKTPVIGEYKFFEDVIISAEKTTGEGGTERGGGNRLIIASNKDDWKRLVKFIEKLDKPQPQVALEVMIVNISTDIQRQLGAQTWGFKGRPGGPESHTWAGINNIEFMNLSSAKPANSTDVTKNAKVYTQLAQDTYEGTQSPSFIALGESADPWTLIKARYSIDNQHIISQPYIVANNNQPCTVEVKSTTLVAGALESKKGETSVQKRDKVEAKNTVKITPRINLDGIVDLVVEITIDEFQGDPLAGQPIILNRSINTRTSLYTGEVLVLGGLTKGKDTDDIYKTPILGDLPIIGSLFKNKTKTHTETNLYVFIRPSIIKPKFEGGTDEYSQLKIDYAKYQMMSNDPLAKERDPIQRWFFKPNNQSAKQAFTDSSKGIFRPIDDFAYGKESPKSVRIKEDPYFKVSEAITEHKKQRELSKRKKPKKKQPEITGPTTIKLA